MKKVFLLCAAMLFICGCESLDDAMDLTWEEILADKAKPKYQPRYTLSFNRIIQYPRGSHLEKELPTASGKSVWINRNRFLGSDNIEEVVLAPSRKQSGKYDLRLKLNRRGRLQWMQISLHFRSEKIALLIDGVYYRSLYPGAITNEEDDWVLLKGPFDLDTAKEIVKYSKKNYKYYLPDHKKPIFGDD